MEFFLISAQKYTVLDLITAPCAKLRFFKTTGKTYVSTYTKGTLKQRSAKDLSNDAHVFFLHFFSFHFLCKSIPV